MNALTTSGGTGMVPTSFDQALRFAEMMAKSKMVPKHFQGKPEECLVIIEQAMRWEMSPYAVIQCASMIHDRPMYEGKLVAAVVNARGPRFGLQGRLHYRYEGAGATRSIFVFGTLAGVVEEIEVKLKDAQTANEMWKKQPDQQLAYHGARVWARRHMPELMLGVYSPEEFERDNAVVAPRDDFAGTTIEAKPEPAAPEPPRRKVADILNEIEERFGLAIPQGRDAVDQMLATDDVQKALDKFSNGAKEKLDAIIKDAIDRTADDGSSAAEPDEVPF